MMDHQPDKTNRDGAEPEESDPGSPAPNDSAGGSYYYDDSTGYEVFEDDDGESEETSASGRVAQTGAHGLTQAFVKCNRNGIRQIETAHIWIQHRNS